MSLQTIEKIALGRSFVLGLEEIILCIDGVGGGDDDDNEEEKDIGVFGDDDDDDDDGDGDDVGDVFVLLKMCDNNPRICSNIT